VSVDLLAVQNNARWEVTRLRRSRRIWLLLIPVVASPIGSSIADLYLHVPSPGTAQVLGILVTGGLAALVLLDLTALAVGEDLVLRTHYLTFALPQSRTGALVGRLAVVIGGSLAAYAIGSAAVVVLASRLVPTAPTAIAPVFPPAHLAFAMLGVLLGLGGVTAAAGAITRDAASALVAGVLTGVVMAGVASYLLLEGWLTVTFPVALAVAGVLGLVIALDTYRRLDA
jgi:hypothetical protein